MDVPGGSKPQADKQDNGVLGTRHPRARASMVKRKLWTAKHSTARSLKLGEWVYPAKQGQTSKAQAVGASTILDHTRGG